MNRKRKVKISSNRFKKIMKLRQYTLNQLAEETAIPFETLKNNLYHGEIMPDLLELVCEELNVSPLWVKGEEEAQPPLFTVVSVKNPEALHILPAIDGDGLEIPSYFQYENSKREKKIEDTNQALYLFLSKAISSEGLTPAFLDSHYEEIRELIGPAVQGVARLVWKETGCLSIIHPLKRVYPFPEEN